MPHARKAALAFQPADRFNPTRTAATLLYAAVGLGALAFIFTRLSAAFGDPSAAGLLTSMSAITLLPFLGLGEDRSS